MSHTITIRLTPEQAEWLAETAAMSGIAQGKIIRDLLENAKTSKRKAFMRLAGRVSGASDLSSRKGFSRK